MPENENTKELKPVTAAVIFYAQTLFLPNSLHRENVLSERTRKDYT